MPGRKIIQIAGATSGDNGNRHSVMFALCADGSTWRYSLGSTWQRIPDIPGDTIDADETQTDEYKQRVAKMKTLLWKTALGA